MPAAPYQEQEWMELTTSISLSRKIQLPQIDNKKYICLCLRWYLFLQLQGLSKFRLLSPPANGVDIISHDDTRTFFHMQLSLTSSVQILSQRERERLLMSATFAISFFCFCGSWSTECNAINRPPKINKNKRATGPESLQLSWQNQCPRLWFFFFFL